MLNKIASKLQNRAYYRHLLFATASFIAILLIGYHFGTFDQVIHIPFLKKFADPGLFPNDPFLELRNEHYSYFWFFFIPFYKAGILEPTLFVVHFIITYLTFWTFWELSEELFHNPLTSLIAIIIFAVPHTSVGGFPLIEFSLLNRTFVLPFVIFSILLYLRGKPVLAFALGGLLYNLHVISVNFLMAMLLFDSLLQFKKIGWKNITAGLVAFVAFALPVLVWKFGGSSLDLTVHAEWFDVVSRGVFAHLYTLISPHPAVLAATACGVASVVIFFIARHYARPAAHDKTITNFVLAAILVAILQLLSMAFYPATIIVQSQIIRILIYTTIFAFLYFANYIVSEYQSGKTTAAESTALTLGAAFSILTPLTVLVWGLWKWLKTPRARVWGVGIVISVAFGTLLFIATQINFWAPGIWIYPRQTDWIQTQNWARENTPRDAIFITPPQIWGLYEPDWRVFSERSTVSTFSEILEFSFAPHYFDYWKERFEAVAPGAIAKFDGDYFNNIVVTRDAYYSLNEKQFFQIAKEFDADYLVLEKPHLSPWPVVYENDSFAIYDLRQAK